MKSLSRDISVTLLLKLLLLFGLWYVCFSAPVKKSIHTPDLAKRLLGEHVNVPIKKQSYFSTNSRSH